MMPEVPYYAVIFSSVKNDEDDGYNEMAEKMLILVEKQPGFLGVESVRSQDGFGITVSYWSSLEAIKNWKENSSHLLAQKLGNEKWYKNYTTRVCKVERHSFLE